jgi:FkbM family methyltransferase
MAGDTMIPRWIKSPSKIARLPEVCRCAHEIRGWQRMVRAYLQFGQASYPLPFETRSGLRVDLPCYDDLVTAWVVFCRKEYTIPRSARFVLDLGANNGYFALFAAESAPKCRIVSVEPFPETFKQLCANVENNHLRERVECWPLAVTGSNGIRRMSAAPMSSPVRHLLPALDPGGSPSVEVEAIDFEDLVDRACTTLGTDDIDLAKFDIEGSEYEVLQRASHATLRRIRAVQMEYHFGPRVQLFEALESAGFRCTRHIPRWEDGGICHFVRA